MPAAVRRPAFFVLTLVALASPPSDAATEGETFFETEIRPVLATRCVSCHGPERQAGGARLDSREGVAASNEDGLFSATIRGAGTAPAACVLEPRLAEAFERWIEAGLPWPERATVTSEEDRAEAGRRHWAFQPVREPAVPDLPGGAGHPLDAFVRARLVEAGLTPSPEADRRTLLRRLSYTLTGLPPDVVIGEPSTVNGSPFTDDEWIQLVDRLLASPHYGEHWARHWLDVARYSDTKGYVYAREEKSWPHAWTHRNWVVS